MYKETVDVIESNQDKVSVKFTRKQACSGCNHSHICQVNKDHTITVDNPGFSLQKGDRVEVGIEEKKSLLAIIITFLIPAIIFIFFLIIFKETGEVISFFLAIFIIIAYYLITKRIIEKCKYFNIKILNKV